MTASFEALIDQFQSQYGILNCKVVGSYVGIYTVIYAQNVRLFVVRDIKIRGYTTLLKPVLYIFIRCTETKCAVSFCNN